MKITRQQLQELCKTGKTDGVEIIDLPNIAEGTMINVTDVDGRKHKRPFKKWHIDGRPVTYIGGSVIWNNYELPNDEWIKWNGGECPVPAGTKTEVMFMNGNTKIDSIPEGWAWNHGQF